jgi:hypothetical protein
VADIVVDASCMPTQSAQQGDHYQHEHDEREAAGGDANGPLAPPELGMRAVARIATLRRRPDPVLIVIEAIHASRLPATRLFEKPVLQLTVTLAASRREDREDLLEGRV